MKKKVDWPKWAAISEIVGMVAVVISLIFVGVSIQQNTAALEASQLNFLTDLSDRWYSDQVTNPEIYGSYSKLANNKQLTSEEEIRLKEQIWRSLTIWEELFERHQRGLISDDIYGHEHAGYAQWMRGEVPKSWWDDDLRDWGLHPELIPLIDAAYRDSAHQAQ